MSFLEYTRFDCANGYIDHTPDSSDYLYQVVPSETVMKKKPDLTPALKEIFASIKAGVEVLSPEADFPAWTVKVLKGASSNIWLEDDLKNKYPNEIAKLLDSITVG